MSKFPCAELLFKEDGLRSVPLDPSLELRGIFAISENQVSDFVNDFSLYENVGLLTERKRREGQEKLGHQTLSVCLRSKSGKERLAYIDEDYLDWMATYIGNQDYYDENGAVCFDFVRSCWTGDPHVFAREDYRLKKLAHTPECWRDAPESSEENSVVEIGDILGIKKNNPWLGQGYIGHVMTVAGEVNGQLAYMSKLGDIKIPVLHNVCAVTQYYGSAPMIFKDKTA